MKVYLIIFFYLFSLFMHPSEDLSSLEKLPIEVGILESEGLTLSNKKPNNKIIYNAEKNYFDALEMGELIKNNQGFKSVFLYVRLDEDDIIVSMTVEFIHPKGLARGRLQTLDF